MIRAEKALRGMVTHGDGLGRKLGYPTANIKTPPRRLPPHGVYAALVSGAGMKNRPAVSSVGTRPTVGGTKPVAEIHIPGFSGTLYGRRLSVAFLWKIRDQKKFRSLKSLKKQIALDIAAAEKLFRRNGEISREKKA